MSEAGQSPEKIAATASPGTAAEFVPAWADIVLNHRDWAAAMHVAHRNSGWPQHSSSSTEPAS